MYRCACSAFQLCCFAERRDHWYLAAFGLERPEVAYGVVERCGITSTWWLSAAGCLCGTSAACARSLLSRRARAATAAAAHVQRVMPARGYVEILQILRARNSLISRWRGTVATLRVPGSRIPSGCHLHGGVHSRAPAGGARDQRASRREAERLANHIRRPSSSSARARFASSTSSTASCRFTRASSRVRSLRIGAGQLLNEADIPSGTFRRLP